MSMPTTSREGGCTSNDHALKIGEGGIACTLLLIYSDTQPTFNQYLPSKQQVCTIDLQIEQVEKNVKGKLIGKVGWLLSVNAAARTEH